MTDLRKAAEMALNYFESAYELDSHEIEIRATLRQALAQPEQKPVAWVYRGILHEFDPSEFATSEVKPLYTAPPKREWQGLTDDEIGWIWHKSPPDSHSYARAIEDALRSKNI